MRKKGYNQSGQEAKYVPLAHQPPPEEPVPDFSLLSKEELQKRMQALRSELLVFYNFNQAYLNRRSYKTGTDITIERGLRSLDEAIRLIHYIETAED